ncbi:MAG: FAD binding domain-containing protein [Actinomycetes bacterium]
MTPRNLADAAAMAAANPGAHLLTGGTDFMVEVNFNHRKPADVISLSRVEELRQWSVDRSAGTVFIGAAVVYADMEKGELAGLVPALAEAARTVGSPQIRSAGTLGGNLGTCSPAGDGLPVLAALDAVVHLSSADGDRALPFTDFMTGPKRNDRRPGEIITGVTVPVADGFQGYAKVGVRNAMVISIASACLAVRSGRVSIALGSVGPTVIRATAAEEWLSTAGSPHEEVAREFGARVAAEARPIDDHRSTAAYRRHAVAVISTRLLERSTAR